MKTKTLEKMFKIVSISTIVILGMIILYQVLINKTTMYFGY